MPKLIQPMNREHLHVSLCYIKPSWQTFTNPEFMWALTDVHMQMATLQRTGSRMSYL